MKRMLCLAVAVLGFALPRPALAQWRATFGAGGGIAGSTDASLSEGTGGPVLMGQVTTVIVPLVRLGAEVDYWRRRRVDVTFATAVLQFHIPVTGLFINLGAGYGSGDPDGKGTVSGPAGQIGAAYDISLPGAAVALTVFGNAFLAHASARSVQMVAGGLAVTFW